MSEEQKNAILEHFRYVLPLLNDICVQDLGIALTDREKYLFYKPGKKLAFKSVPNRPVQPGSAVARALEEKRRVVIRADKSVFGVPYIASAFPITDDSGEVIGCAVATESVELQDKMMEMANTLNENIGVLASTVEELSAQAEEIASVCTTLAQSVLDSQNRVKETNGIIGIMKDIAGHINLLGLNAAIEAARVGDAGRGFGVVAEEIRKLSTGSADSIKKVEQVVTAIQADSDNNYTQLVHVNEVVNQIAAAISHVADAVQQSGGLVRDLNQLAEDLSKDAD
ncbi:methyl-accepting chemotaxis protein [Anaeroselena agilis]|uniref:Methyl-accepting chemotaxis protein n=1 Tax=Anaeroselena agilis TaxID=3063788 RepID=A0ABU3P461_9FIRM|nr:methyl-accepting chemotaxis protein [Selenomonadales bacterium 4137-cl]